MTTMAETYCENRTKSTSTIHLFEEVFEVREKG